jgi:hypothetical protein
MLRRAISVVCLVGALCGWVDRLRAHDLPADVHVQALVKAEDQRLRLIVRVPLVAMGDVDYPTRGAAGLMDLSRIDRALRDAVALWIVPGVVMYENDRPLGQPRVAAARVSLPSDRSFTDYDQALANFGAPPVAPEVDLYWNQALLDVLLEYDIVSATSSFAIQPLFARLGVQVVTAVRFVPSGGAVRAFEFRGDPGRVRLDPRWHQAAFRFVQLGFEHILEGTDHLLFLLCLVIPLRRLRALIPVVTAFAVAHSITLLASAFGMTPAALWFPPLIETMIAASIVYMAIENILAPRFDHRWVMAFLFGLVHGFGFAFALGQSLQFAGTHLVMSLLAFNVGVEIGQVLVVALLIPPMNFVCRHARSERVGTIVLSAVVAHTAWHWMTDRGQALGQFTFRWPAVDAGLAVGVADWLLLGTVAAAMFWLLAQAVKRWSGRPDAPRR